jgi:hypothetical protein
MRAILHALDISRFKEQAAKIHECWQTFLLQSGTSTEPEYPRCYPDHVISWNFHYRLRLTRQYTPGRR